MNQYNVVAENPESTVVAEYQPINKRETTYQSEAAINGSVSISN